ncbi:response regulator transcription factor [Bacillus smithii]|uniref:response regulator transcription factor n=1 Tax=Bacillus smithii TaxID=1479 RepID=UPI002E1C76B3|nr:response regulator transcription factor [Bacillus smithii]MED1457696.1 response regulator transcription factor [Bacillus smithii]
MWKVLLVEDQPIVRQGLKMMMEQDPEIQVIQEAENGLEALKCLERNHVDLAVIDIRMPVMNGLEATREIKKRWPHVKILILTTFNDEEYAEAALRDGASGFLLKSAEPQAFIRAIHSCMSGGITIHEEVAAKVVPKLFNHPKPAIELPLSPREKTIAILVGEGKSNREIAVELYLSVGTVKNHISQILQKLHLRDRTQLAIFAVKNGLC